MQARQKQERSWWRWGGHRGGEERGHAYGGVERVVVGEFGEGNTSGPIGLLIVEEGTHLMLDGLVDAFRLTIRLRVEGGG